MTGASVSVAMTYCQMRQEGGLSCCMFVVSGPRMAKMTMRAVGGDVDILDVVVGAGR